jgi:mitogen-activated protein kinase 1/3
MEKDDFHNLEKWTDYKVVQELGSGAYSTVYEGLHVPTGTKVAIKKMCNLFGNLVDCKRILREVMLLRQMGNVNIIRLYDVVIDLKNPTFDTIYLILELADASLRDVISSPLYLVESQIKKIFMSVLLGLKYLHSAGILHRDLKPANILVYEDCAAKICDFGLARTALEVSCPLSLHKMILKAKKEQKKLGLQMTPETTTSTPKASEEEKKQMLADVKSCRVLKKRLTMHVVTRWYRAPEVVLTQPDYEFSIDVWAAGCIFAELLELKKENVPNFKERRPLFPGFSCFPLSPTFRLGAEEHDQLNVILDVIGTPAEKDCAFINSSDTIQELLTMAARPRMDFPARYPGSPKEAIDLLDRMLQFNPYTRIGIDECIAHPYLASARARAKILTAAHPASLEFESEEGLTEAKLRALFTKEAQYYAKLKADRKLYTTA